MPISGNYFKYDNIMSQQYGLLIVNIKTDHTYLPVNGKQKYITVNLPLGTKFYSLGRKIEEPFSFDAEIGSQSALDDNQDREICDWMFERNSYHKWEFISPEYADVYYNCRFINAEKIYSALGVVGYKFTVVCDAPWAWENQKTAEYNFASSPSNINFINTSDDDNIMRPKMIITCGSTGGTVSVLNQNDSNNLVQFNGLSANEVITLDELGQLSSSTGNSRYNNWNLNRLILVPKDNNLTITGDITKLQIIYQNVRRIGY